MAKPSSRRAAQAAALPAPPQKSRLPWVAAALFVLLSAILYGFTLPFPFVFDDDVYLLKNPLVQDAKNFGYMKNFSTFVTDPHIKAIDPDLAINFALRPVTYFSFFANFALDGFNPRWFRVVNIIIHAGNALLLFHLLWFLLRHSPKAAGLPEASVRFITLSASLLFLVHPLQTESVTYIVQRFTSLATFFYLLVIYAHLRARQVGHAPAARWWRWGSVAALVTGMFTKENVFTAPFMLVVIDWMLMGDALKLAARRAVPQLLCLPIIPAMLLTASHAQTQGTANTGEVLNIVNYNQDSPLNYLLTEFSVILTYLKLMLVPTGLNLDPHVKASTSFFQPRVLGSLAIILGLLAAAGVWYRKRGGDVRVALISCGVVWFFVGLAIESSIVPLPDLMAEHRCYLSTIGVFTALVCGLDLLRTRAASPPALRQAVVAGVAVWVATLSVATVVRNHDWRSTTSIWENSAQGSPKKARPWFNLAGAYYTLGDLEKSAQCTRTVIALEPRWVDAYVNLSTIENNLGRHESAIEVARAGSKVAPVRCELHYGMALGHAKLRQFDEAAKAALQVIQLNSSYRKAYLLLGDIYTSTERFEQALQQYRLAASLSPLEPPVMQTVNQIQELLARRQAAR